MFPDAEQRVVTLQPVELRSVPLLSALQRGCAQFCCRRLLSAFLEGTGEVGVRVRRQLMSCGTSHDARCGWSGSRKGPIKLNMLMKSAVNC